MDGWTGQDSRTVRSTTHAIDRNGIEHSASDDSDGDEKSEQETVERRVRRKDSPRAVNGQSLLPWSGRLGVVVCFCRQPRASPEGSREARDTKTLMSDVLAVHSPNLRRRAGRTGSPLVLPPLKANATPRAYLRPLP